MPPTRRLAIALTAGVLSAAAPAQPADLVRLEPTPNGGLQPRAERGSDGSTHLLYFAGEPGAGDLLYVRRDADDAPWSEPIRVNSTPGSAVAAGTMRGGRLALGPGGAVHAAWNGSAAVSPSPHEGPMLYARLAPGADAFDEQRNLMTRSGVLDGGGDVAATADGRVFVAWHAVPEGAEAHDETGRRVLVALSTDGGETFAAETEWSSPASGACGCCGLSVGVERAADGAETPVVLYRAARDRAERGMRLVREPAGAPREEALDAWPLLTCPASTASIGAGGALAWESRAGVSFRTRPGAEPRELARKGAKHPAVATDAGGRVLVAWTEDTGWARPGRLCWLVVGESGDTLDEGRAGPGSVPAWGLAAPIAREGGGFIVFH